MPRIDSNLPLQWGAMCQCDAELEQLRAALDEEASAAFRQVLSHHTTTACQPRKASGSVSSLKASGLKTGLTANCRLARGEANTRGPARADMGVGQKQK